MRPARRALAARLRGTGEVEVIAAQEQVATSELAERMASSLLGEKLDACVLNVPVFAFPSFTAIAARILHGVPLLAISPANGSYPGLGGLRRQVGHESARRADSARRYGGISKRIPSCSACWPFCARRTPFRA